MKAFRNLLIAMAAAAGLLPISVYGLGEDNPTGVTGVFNGNVTSGCSYDPYTGNAFRSVTDLAVWGAVGDYPLVFNRTFTSRGGTGPFGSGGPWYHNYSWSVWDNKPSSPNQPSSYTIQSGNGSITYTPLGAGANGWWRGNKGTSNRLEIQYSVGMGDGQLILHTPDGGQAVFWIQETLIAPPSKTYDGPDYVSRKYVCTSLIDPSGRVTSLAYDSANKIVQITEPGGRWIKCQYTGSLLSGLTSSYGQSVAYNYTTFGTYSVLQSVNYYNDTAPGGSPYPYTQATYTYQDPPGFPGSAPLLSTCDDPHFAGAMTKIKYTYWGNMGKGFLQEEQHPNGIRVSRLDVPDANTRLETRFDGTSRRFTYSSAFLTSASNFSATGTYDAVTYYGYDVNGYQSSVTDAEGRTTQMTREAVLGKLTRVTHPSDGSSASYIYTDPNNPTFLASKTDELGRTTSYSRNSFGQVTRIDYPTGGGYETFTYSADALRLPATHTLRSSSAATSGATVSYTYDTAANISATAFMWENNQTVGLPSGAAIGRGLLTSVSSSVASDGIKQIFYDCFGRVTATRDARGYQEKLVTDHMGRVRKQQHDGANYSGGTNYSDISTVVYAYDAYGNRIQTTDEMGNPIVTTFDDYRRPLTQTVQPNSRVTTFTYRYRDNTVAAQSYAFTDQTPQLVQSPGGKYAAVDLSPDRWVLKAYTGLWTNDATYVRSEYDKTGRVTRTLASKNLASAGWGPERVLSLNHFDARGRLDYQEDGLANRTTYAYDAAGNKTLVTLPNLKTIQYNSYDAMNRPTLITDERGKQTTFSYFASGSVNTLTDANGKSYSYGYDALGRKTLMTYPGGSTETWVYGLDGLLSTYQNRSGVVQTFVTYDHRKRLLSFNWSDGTPGTTFAYDPASRKTSMANTNATLTWQYDAGNRVTFEGQQITVPGAANQAVGVAYAYNADNLVTGMTYPNGTRIGTSYNGNNQLLSRGLADTNYTITTPIVAYTYNGDGTIMGRDTLTGANGVHTGYIYDGDGRIQSFQTTVAQGGANITKRTYGYDALSRITYFTKDVVGASTSTENGKGDFFAYDEAGQLLGGWHEATGVATATPAAPPVGAQRSEVYTYDPTGNRLTSSLNGSSAGAYTLNTSGLNQYATAASLGNVTYDSRGNTTAMGSPLANCVYDANNRLVSAVNPTLPSGQCRLDFAYDPLGRCVARTTGPNQAGNSYSTGILNYYSSWNVIEDRSGAGATQRVYVQGRQVDEIAAVGIYSGGVPVWYAYHYDALGNVTHLTGAGGAVQERYSYDAFGIPYLVDGATGNATAITSLSASVVGRRFAFQGHEYIPQVGLYDFRNRVYNPQIGRFMQPDPLKLGAGDANIYRFCKNDPVNHRDPNGTDPTDREGDPIRPYDNMGWMTWGQALWQFRFGLGQSVSVDAQQMAQFIGPVYLSDFEGHSSVNWTVTGSMFGGTNPNMLPAGGINTDAGMIYGRINLTLNPDGASYSIDPDELKIYYVGDWSDPRNFARDTATFLLDIILGDGTPFTTSFNTGNPNVPLSGAIRPPIELNPDGIYITILSDILDLSGPDGGFGGLTSMGGGSWQGLLGGSETVFGLPSGGNISIRFQRPNPR